MKIAINYNYVNDAFGGGNRFYYDLESFLISNNNIVTNQLEQKDIDIILIMDPRHTSPHFTFGIKEVLNYIKNINPLCVVVHRINECDERKNTKFMNYHLKVINYYADYTVFIGSWLKNLNLWIKNKPNTVILNGINKSIFFKKNLRYSIPKKLKIVTHHWGGNYLKGFDIYKYLDENLENTQFRNSFSFTYIGNKPKNIVFKNVLYKKPMNGKKLADELRNHHIYLTASINEPGGMHHIEGASCGLPLLYRNSGALPEYCRDFGVVFNGKNDFIQNLLFLKNNFNEYITKIESYSRDSVKTSENYLNLFEHLSKNKSSIIKKRNFNNLFFNFLAKNIPFI